MALFLHELARHGMPLAFATGCGGGADLPGDIRGVPVARKPCTGAATR